MGWASSFGQRVGGHSPDDGNQHAEVQPTPNRSRQVPGRAVQLPTRRLRGHLSSPILLRHLRDQTRSELESRPVGSPASNPTGVHHSRHLRNLLQHRQQQEEVGLLSHLFPGKFRQIKVSKKRMKSLNALICKRRICLVLVFRISTYCICSFNCLLLQFIFKSHFSNIICANVCHRSGTKTILFRSPSRARFSRLFRPSGRRWS